MSLIICEKQRLWWLVSLVSCFVRRLGLLRPFSAVFGDTFALEGWCFASAWKLVSHCVANCPHLGYGSISCSWSRGPTLVEVRLCFRASRFHALCQLRFPFIDLLYSVQCNSEDVSFSILFVGNAGQSDAVIDLAQRDWKACSRFKAQGSSSYVAFRRLTTR